MRTAVQPGQTVYNQAPAYGLTGAYAALQRNPGQPMAARNPASTYVRPMGAGSSPGVTDNRDLAMRTAQGGIDGLERFVQPGVQGSRLAAALSGALGNDAQAQAMTNYQESPYLAFQRERGEQAIRRNAAASGGLRGGNFQKALLEYNNQLGLQDFDNYFNRVSGVADRGVQAASFQNPLITTQANAATNAGSQEVSLANSRNSLTGARLGANASIENALIGADLARDRDAAQYAYGAGQQLAGQEAATTSALAELVNQQGLGINQYAETGVGNLANLLTGFGRDQSLSSGNFATLLANIASGSAANAGNLSGIPGVQNTRGIADSLGNLLAGGASAAQAYAGA